MQENKSMKETIFHIYDRIFKRIFNLSNTAIINLINGLFNKNYPPDSKIFYANKEFVKRNLQGRVADIFINIDGDTFHLEAMISKDMMIQVRVMEYGFYYAMENQEDVNVLDFPEPMVIYLNEEKNIPEYSVLKLRFKGQGTFEYRVKNFLYQEHDIVELNQRKLIILIPFQLLKLQELIRKNPTEENLQRLKELIHNDILGSIKANLLVGNITEDDASQLRELTILLYEHICQHYEELGGLEDMKPLLEGAIELPLDKYRIRIDELEKEVAKKARVEAEKAKLEEEKAKAEEEKAKAEEEKAKAEEQAARAKEENRKLLARIKELEGK